MTFSLPIICWRLRDRYLREATDATDDDMDAVDHWFSQYLSDAPVCALAVGNIISHVLYEHNQRQAGANDSGACRAYGTVNPERIPWHSLAGNQRAFGSCADWQF